MIPIKTLDRKLFKKFGMILEPDDKEKVFSVLCGDEKAAGWRIGYLVSKPENVNGMEAHPESMETFEPVKGTAVIVVAPQNSPENIEAFLLDKPVCLDKNIWHAVSVISDAAEIKITENYNVESVYYKLKKPIDVGFA